MKPVVFLYPHGGGGSWLNNLIYHLETRDRSLPKVNIVYDGQPRSSIPVLHPIGWGPGTSPAVPANILDDEYERKIMFSSSYPFNLYLNYMIKIAFPTYHIDKLPLVEQFFQLTNQARHWLENKVFAETYYVNIDLDYSLIFCNPDLFIKQLFKILDTIDIDYEPDYDYALSHLKEYQTTCPNPIDYFDNYSQLAWLGWCHALTFTNDISVNGKFIEANTINDIAKILSPNQNKFTELTRPLMFNWL